MIVAFIVLLYWMFFLFLSKRNMKSIEDFQCEILDRYYTQQLYRFLNFINLRIPTEKFPVTSCIQRELDILGQIGSNIHKKTSKMSIVSFEPTSSVSSSSSIPYSLKYFYSFFIASKSPLSSFLHFFFALFLCNV